MKLRIARKIARDFLSWHAYPRRTLFRALKRAARLSPTSDHLVIYMRGYREFISGMALAHAEARLASLGFEPVTEEQREMNRLNWELYGRP